MPVGNKIPLVWDIATRDGTLTKDAKMGNLVVSKEALGTQVQKRAGLQLWQQQVAGLAVGSFIFEGSLFVIQRTAAGDIAYQVSYFQNTPATGIPLQAATTHGFYQTLPVSLTNTIGILKDARYIWTFNGATFTYVSAAPAIYFVWGIAELDGTFYVMDLTTIYASAYGDVTTWPGLNTVNMNPSYGGGVAIALHQSYIVAFSQFGTQFFYDAGISPGAPIAQVQNGAIGIGCASGASIASFEDILYFAAQDANSTLSIGMFTGLTFTKISTAAIDKILLVATKAPSNANPVMIGSTGIVQGKAVYILNLMAYGMTLVYDIADSLWSYWSTVVAGVEGNFNGVFWNPGGGSWGVYVGNQSSFMCGLTDGAIYQLSPTIYQDNGQSIHCFIRTAQLDAGTYATKFVSGAYLHSDTISTTVSVTYSNDDYQTFANSRTIDMSTQKKMLIGGGSYRHRSWDLLHTDNTPFRVMDLELDLAPTDDSNQ